ncbi:FAS1 domain-containing protein [Beauveria bassiana]|uniref:FAS1 domain-containing protein n=2 Tax=Beauveria bassiana TaxID=176275 RepID=J5JTL1_BEAB2|nr:FAS1 domain-containing protein [Beauveria bassiana ARSEF 2860]EJP65921.1 FAS1 domain-containing protein [Beauveria bassiana ARSEF 2860]KAF1737851.1 FAS1 domain-containing protein [Beauveria bassiana]KAH8718889.1 FAS1 domain-containing protein [Beauveria bassiana]
MRRPVIALSSCLILLPTVAALRSSPRSNHDVTTPRRTSPQNHLATMPGTTTANDHPVQLAVRLSDTLGSQRAVGSFSSFARQHEASEERLGSDADKTTVLAPLNSAVDALPRKPWEDERELGELGANAYEGDDGKARADANLGRFVEAHLVTESPWEAGQKAKTMAGREVWWEESENGTRVVMPDKVEVDKVAIEVGNGQIWILKGVLKFQ